MAAQLMKADRSFAIDCGTSAPAPSNNSRSVNGYDAYFGTYTVDETNHTVTHHLEGALATADVGKSLVRTFQVSGSTLKIVVRTNSPQGQQIRTLVFERVGRITLTLPPSVADVVGSGILAYSETSFRVVCRQL